MIKRFNLLERIQHIILLISVIMLMVTGLSLLFYNSWPGKYLIFLEGGPQNRGRLHHIFAIILISLFIFHVFYVTFSRKGHYEIFKLRFTKKDFKYFIINIKFNLGLIKEKPSKNRYDLAKKIHYWLVVSGCIIMILTGTIILLKVWGLGMIFPKWIWDITIIIHSNQAIMIFLVLFLWHIYDILFKRGIFRWIRSAYPEKANKEMIGLEHE
jgi:cytochrome b subunit of formate dehydrogenase